ncbi:MAG: ECF-type sigma factor [Myxococcota bacterium]
MDSYDLRALLSQGRDLPLSSSALLGVLQHAAHRALRRERANSLETGDLANEVFLRLVEGQSLSIEDHQHLRRLVAYVTRHVLVDRARARKADKRGGNLVRVTYSERDLAEDGVDIDVLTLHALLDRLATLDPRVAEIVELRVFGGSTAHEVAQALAISRATVQSEWAFALTWLRKHLGSAHG